MALPASGTISVNDVNTEFGLGQNLNAYRGQLYGTTSGTAGVFSSGAISLSDFYSTAKVVAGGPTGLSAGSYTVPPYRTITFTATGGAGGATGANGVYSGGPNNGLPTSGSAGSSGTASTVAAGATTYVSGAGGGPGAAGTTTSATSTNPVLGGTGPASGSAVTVTMGPGGAGGQGGPIFNWNGSSYVLIGYAGTGATGAAGTASVSWTA